MAAFLDACRFNPTAGGTTDWTYSSVVNGYQSPASANVTNGRLYKYRAESADLSQWELGEGTYNNGTGVLTRTTVLFNSSGTTSKINFSTVPQVAIVALKSDLISVEEANGWTYLQKARGRSNLDALKKNFLINGAMMVSLQNGSSSVTASFAYPVEMFCLGFSNAGTQSAQQVASYTPSGSPNRLRVTCSTADASVGASDYCGILTAIEGNQLADLKFNAGAKQFILQFGVRAPQGTYGVSFRNGSGARSYVGEYSISAGEANSDVVKAIALTGDTTGSWSTDNSLSMSIMWTLMCGSTYQASAGAWTAGNFFGTSSQFNFMGTNGNVFELFDVGLYEGDTAPVFQVPEPALETIKCMRYWQKFTWSIEGYAASANVRVAGTSSLAVPMRTQPSRTRITTGSSSNIRGSDPASFVLANAVSDSQIVYSAEAAATGNVQALTFVEGFSARLI
ncbi:MAG: hypothetical protein PS018_04505 [bacterium]|nr:hypothetical protein [bacterium]